MEILQSPFGDKGAQSKPDLHIISFGVPYPANYGGAIDVWNRSRALHREGLRIMLHCFVYSSFKPHDAIKEVVSEVHYYPRISWPALLNPGQPYIVASRKNPMLLKRLKNDNAPILFEGIHTTGYMDDLKGRKLLLRAHNIEHQYYSCLAKDSQRFQYLFFQREALALERYEGNNASSFDAVFAISKGDKAWYDGKMTKCMFLPVFHGFEEINVPSGRGKYLLYQGDLSIESNQKSLFELLNLIPRNAQYPMVVAGKSGEEGFEQKLIKYPNLIRETNVTTDRMAELIRDAQIILIHSRHPSGMKVKIFPALYQGRFIAANENSLTHTDLDKALHIYPLVQELGSLLKKLWPMEFSASHAAERTAILSRLPSVQEKAKHIIQH
ncbi:MAG: hypothetical protein ABIQ02_02475, partial [Saprospiraceae bacterium]